MSTDAQLRWTVGDVTVTRVEERITAVPVEMLVPGITERQVEREGDWVAPFFTEAHDTTCMLLSVHTFVVESEGLTILVDTCVGSGFDRPLPADDAFIDRVDAAVAGGRPGVDVVLCTHLHFDHVGWNTIDVDGERMPTFPNARYLFGRVELDHFDDHAGLGIHAASIAPLLDAGMVDLVETDHRLTDEVCLFPTPGHTVGHASVLIESHGESAIITGDAFHTPLQMAHPELTASPFDHDSDQATTTRRAVIARYADSDTLVLGTHFPPPTAGRIVSIDDRNRFTT